MMEGPVVACSERGNGSFCFHQRWWIPWPAKWLL